MHMTPSRKVLSACVLLTAFAFAAETPNQQDAKALIEAGHIKRAMQMVDARLQKNPKDAEALYFSSQIKEKAGDSEGAIAAAEQAVSLDPNKATYHIQLGETLGTKAQKASMFSAL